MSIRWNKIRSYTEKKQTNILYILSMCMKKCHAKEIIFSKVPAYQI